MSAKEMPCATLTHAVQRAVGLLLTLTAARSDKMLIFFCDYSIYFAPTYIS